MKLINQFLDFIRNRHENIYRFLMATVIGLLIVWMYPTQVSFKYEFYQGSPWQSDDLFAPFDFAILKTERELNNEKEELKSGIFPIYSFESTVADSVKKRFAEQWEKYAISAEVDSMLIPNYDSLKTAFLASIDSTYRIGVIQLDDHAGTPANGEYIYLEKGAKSGDRLVSDFFTLKTAIQNIAGIPVDSSSLSYDKLLGWIASAVQYNITFDEKLTKMLIDDELKSISPFRGRIKKGTMLIQRGEIVSAEKNQILLSLQEQYENKLGLTSDVGWLLIGELLSTSVVLWLLFQYIRRYNRKLILRPNGWLFVLVFFPMAVLMYRWGVYDAHLNPYLFPIFIFPIIIRAFFDVRLAIIVHILILFVSAGLVPNPYEFIFMQVLAGMIVLFSLKGLRKRSQFFITTILIFGSYSLVYFSVAIYSVGQITEIDLEPFGYFAGNAILSLIAYPLIYLFEKLFGYLSELTLVEMTDMSNRLLRELAEKAPGTFQHSMQVGNLAESAIREIGGNPLLVRVGAYYHDIGKLKNPAFFIENQNQGINPHDDLSYDESARIIVDHVRDGIKMARKNNLPEVIIDFIRTHHGTTRVEYFYRMQKKEHPDEPIDAEEYTYPGPKPYSKETAVLMMADGVEAASRSLKTYTKESIHQLIDGIIDGHIQKGQFEFADVNFKEINRVKRVFRGLLQNIYHVRLEYPEA